jgi:hypothetical protein
MTNLTIKQFPRIALLATLTFATAGPADAALLILNGGFEAGFTNWTRADQLGSEGTFLLQAGTISPTSGTPVPTPPGGVTAAMTDALGPGSHVLYQDFVVPAGTTSGLLAFDLFVGNRANAFFTPSSLDFSTPTLNQQARVDILRGGTGAFSLAAADLLANVFMTPIGSPLVSGYTPYAIDVSALLAANVGSTLRLRFAEVDNVFSFQLGVDNVSIDTAPVPEPASLVLLATGLAVAARRRRRN